MTTGTLTAADEEAGALQHDVFCVLMRLRRQSNLPAITPDLSEAELRAYAAKLANALGAAIGGRYVLKTLDAEQRAARNQAIYSMWNGSNRNEVMRHFGISRRLFYMVISQEARRRRVAVAK